MDKKRASKWVWGVAVLALSVTLAAALALHVRDSNSATSGSFATSAPPAPDRAPDGMAWVPGGSFWMGDPRFPDAHFFRGWVLRHGKHDAAAAIPEYRTFLATNPPQEFRQRVEQELNLALCDVGQAPTGITGPT